MLQNIKYWIQRVLHVTLHYHGDAGSIPAHTFFACHPLSPRRSYLYVHYQIKKKCPTKNLLKKLINNEMPWGKNTLSSSLNACEIQNEEAQNASHIQEYHFVTFPPCFNHIIFVELSNIHAWMPLLSPWATTGDSLEPETRWFFPVCSGWEQSRGLWLENKEAHSLLQARNTGTMQAAGEEDSDPTHTTGSRKNKPANTVQKKERK